MVQGASPSRCPGHIEGRISAPISFLTCSNSRVTHAAGPTGGSSSSRPFEYPLRINPRTWCAFSVLTHLLPEQSYLYLEEAKRVLKPDGRIVFSFLEFRMPFHWSVFASTVDAARGRDEHPLNMFIDRDAIQAWAVHLGLAVLDVRDGDEAFVPLSRPVTLENGQVPERGNLGQSIRTWPTSGAVVTKGSGTVTTDSVVTSNRRTFEEPCR